MMKAHVVWLPLSLLLILPSSFVASADWPSDSKLYSDVAKFWKKQWPDQEFAHVTKKTNCENTELVDEAYQKKTGKTRKLKACLVKADVFIAKGYRFLIYRDSFVYYLWGKIHSVQLGELEKAWKEGGVPAPTKEEASALLQDYIKQKLSASEAEISVLEIGKPRTYEEVYRVTLLINVVLSKEGQQQKHEKIFASLQSDGGPWEPIPDINF